MTREGGEEYVSVPSIGVVCRAWYICTPTVSAHWCPVVYRIFNILF